MTWVAITIFAAFVQNLRFMLQKGLSQKGISAVGATAARYIYSVPFILIVYTAFVDVPIFEQNARFYFFAAFGAIAQILATICVIALFQHRNFAVGTTFKRTETILSALFGMILLGDFVTPLGWVALFLSLPGVILLSEKSSNWSGGFFNRATALGLSAGALFGICGVAYRAASLSIGVTPPIQPALTTLTFSVSLQTILLVIYLLLRETGELSKLAREWRIALPVGITSMLGSAAIFTAFTMVQVAYVNAVQQIELIFAILGSYYFFKENISLREVLGMIIITASIIFLILFG